jgi:hypothetical protein
MPEQSHFWEYIPEKFPHGIFPQRTHTRLLITSLFIEVESCGQMRGSKYKGKGKVKYGRCNR